MPRRRKTMKRFLRSNLLPGALLLFAMLGRAAADTPADNPADKGPTTVAVVNGETITLRDLEKRLEELHGETGPVQRSSANLRRLLDRIINDVLIGQEARSLGLDEEPPIPESISSNTETHGFGNSLPGASSW